MNFLKEPLLSKNRPLSSDDSGSSNGSGEYEPPMASVPQQPAAAKRQVSEFDQIMNTIRNFNEEVDPFDIQVLFAIFNKITLALNNRELTQDEANMLYKEVPHLNIGRDNIHLTLKQVMEIANIFQNSSQGSARDIDLLTLKFINSPTQESKQSFLDNFNSAGEISELSLDRVFASERSIAAMMRLCNEIKVEGFADNATKCTSFNDRLKIGNSSNGTPRLKIGNLTNGKPFDMDRIVASSKEKINLSEIDAEHLDGMIEGMLNHNKMSFNFNKGRFKKVFQTELRDFGIRQGATNRLKKLDLEVQGVIASQELNSQQRRIILNQLNLSTTADLYKYKLQSYFDESSEIDAVIDCFYGSGIARTLLFVNDDKKCTPLYEYDGKVSGGLNEYIEGVLFPYFSNYLINKGILQEHRIYSYFIRFGCIFNPTGNPIVSYFNILSNQYLVDGNVEGSQNKVRDKNVFSRSMPVSFKSIVYLKILNLQLNTNGEPFFLSIDYGNIDNLYASFPYKYILSTLLYMSMNPDVAYEDAKRITTTQEQQLEQVMQQRTQKHQELDRWLKMRTEGYLGTQGGNIQKKQSQSKKSKPKNKKKSSYHKSKCNTKTQKKYCKNKTKKRSK
jgi:hypothetical protein